MGDPVSAGVVGSVVAPSFGAALNPITGALATGMGGGSLFGFDPSIKGVGQGIMETIGGANTWMNQNPMTTQLGLKAAQGLMEQPQVHYAQPGQVSRGQIQPVDYMSLLNPQQQTAIRPATPSLI